jgi:hypothetical protein
LIIEKKSKDESVLVNLKIGDRVKIKDRTDWYLPSGYKPANVEGRVFEVIEELPGYVTVLLEKEVTGIDISIPLPFSIDSLDKI